MMYNTSEKHFWTITNWLAGQDGSYDFGVWVSPRYLAKAEGFIFSKVKFRALCRDAARQGGFSVSESELLAHFGKYGLEKIDSPRGGGRWLSLSLTSIKETGAELSTHNCDLAREQSFLFGIWVKWVQSVEVQF